MNKLAKEINAVSIANGWNLSTVWPDVDDLPNVNDIGTALALIHSEVSEALEALRTSDKPNFGEELADIIIRVLNLSGALEIDIEAEVNRKIATNKQRGWHHGGKAV